MNNNIVDIKEGVSIKKPKILLLSDDIRLHTGVGIQSYKLLKGLQSKNKYDLVQMACSLIKRSNKPIIFEGIKLYPVGNGYGNAKILKHLLRIENPDILICFGDPRFYDYVFFMDNEIREHTKIILYHTWDNDPYPVYNEKWYKSCDDIVTISKFSYDLLSSRGMKVSHIPHGYDETEFFNVSDSDRFEEMIHLKNILNLQSFPDFVVFWNNRNIERKRVGDVIAAFTLFSKTHPNSLLLLNTDAVDPGGTDLLRLQRDLDTGNARIVYNFSKLPVDKLNAFYSISDVSLNISFNEGFGLSTGESLLACTPVIATHTGGIPEQMKNSKDGTTYGILIPPAVKTLWGCIHQPYIYRDYVSIDQVVSALEEAYKMKQHGLLKALGSKGRNFIIKNFNTCEVIDMWEKHIDEVLASPSNYKPWSVETI